MLNFHIDTLRSTINPRDFEADDDATAEMRERIISAARNSPTRMSRHKAERTFPITLSSQEPAGGESL
jgi:hypothetical protein